MNKTFRAGIDTGLVAGAITTSAVAIVLTAASADQKLVLASILAVAFADAVSDSLGGLAKKTEPDPSENKFQKALLIFVLKIVVASTFLTPVLLTQGLTTIVLCILWGLLLVATLGYFSEASHKSAQIINLFKNALMLLVVCALSFWIANVFK